MHRLFLLLSIAATASGCAHATFHATIDPTGNARDLRKFEALTKEANELPPGAADDVKVLIDELPEGMKFEEGKLQYDHARYVVLGSFEVTPDSNFIGLWFDTYDAHEAWKNVYCNLQVPLNWLSIYTWPVLPFFWPCFKGSLDETSRIEHMVPRLQSAGKVLGATVVVATAGDSKWVDARTNQVVSSARATHMRGIAIRELAGPPPRGPERL